MFFLQTPSWKVCSYSIDQKIRFFIQSDLRLRSVYHVRHWNLPQLVKLISYLYCIRCILSLILFVTHRALMLYFSISSSGQHSAYVSHFLPCDMYISPNPIIIYLIALPDLTLWSTCLLCVPTPLKLWTFRFAHSVFLCVCYSVTLSINSHFSA